MSILGPYTHSIDPIIGTVAGMHLWWYGLSYTLGFVNLHRFVMRRREGLRLSPRAVAMLTLLVAAGVLVGGRLVEVFVYEWPFYREHLRLIPAYWLGGMATHGLLLGGVVGVAIFARAHGRRFLDVSDALAVPAAFIMGVGRLGNFIDGQIVGSETAVPWAVKFPDAAGFRHPVVLYDGLKNLALVPVLLAASRGRRRPGLPTGIFIFLYAFLRIFVDLYREYPTSLWGLATGQSLNILMSALGLALLVRSVRRGPAGDAARAAASTTGETAHRQRVTLAQRVALAGLVLLPLTIPSDWTQDVPERYGPRHPGLRHSTLYPPVEVSDTGPGQGDAAAGGSGGLAGDGG